MVAVEIEREWPVLDDVAAASLRQLSDANLIHRATIVAPVTTGLRIGGALVGASDTTLLIDAPCRLVPRRREASDTLEADQLHPVARWYLIFKAGALSLPVNAIATVSGAHPTGEAWTRVVRVAVALDTTAQEIMARYECVDVTPAGR